MAPPAYRCRGRRAAAPDKADACGGSLPAWPPCCFWRPVLSWRRLVQRRRPPRPTTSPHRGRRTEARHRRSSEHPIRPRPPTRRTARRRVRPRVRRRKPGMPSRTPPMRPCSKPSSSVMAPPSLPRSQRRGSTNSRPPPDRRRLPAPRSPRHIRYVRLPNCRKHLPAPGAAVASRQISSTRGAL